MVGISKAIALRFWRNILKMKKESTWWAPHLLNEEQKYTHVRTVRKLFQRFPRYDQKLFINVVTDDEFWMHYFEPHQKISNPVWLTKMQEDYEKLFKDWIKICVSVKGWYFDNLK